MGGRPYVKRVIEWTDYLKIVPPKVLLFLLTAVTSEMPLTLLESMIGPWDGTLQHYC